MIDLTFEITDSLKSDDYDSNELYLRPCKWLVFKEYAVYQ